MTIKKFTSGVAERPVEPRWHLVNSKEIALQLRDMKYFLKNGCPNGHSSLASNQKDSTITNFDIFDSG